MDSGNVFELFSQAVNEGDIVQLDKILNYFKTYNGNLKAERSNSPYFKNKSIPMDFITKPINEQYGTCLEVASKNGHWDILRILLKQFKYHVYKRDLISRPPFSGISANFREKDKIFFRDICSQIPITKLVENLITFSEDNFIWLEFILDALMSSSITRADKIVALELMGAVFIFWWSRNRLSRYDRHLFETSPLKGIQCWKDALILRDATADGEPAIPIIPCVLSEHLRHIFGNCLEEMISGDQEVWERQDNDSRTQRFRIQALLLSHKILSEANPGKLITSHLFLFYHENLLYYAEYLTDDFNQVINIVLFILEICCSDVSHVVSCSKHLLSKHFEMFMRLFSLIQRIQQRFRSLSPISKFMTIFQFFLDVGVDPNEADTNGQAPIHILAKYSAIEGVPFMLKSLLNAGAHIDQATPDGQTIGSILNQQRLQFHLPSFYPFESMSDNPLNVVLPLSCYCAQSIRRNEIPYEDQLPARFHEFVSIH